MYLIHRWTGIALCILFAIWFISGVVMMYVSFPSFRAQERVELAQPIDWSLVKFAPEDVLAATGNDAVPDEMRLEMTGGAPVYRMTFGAERRAWSAVTGEEILGVTKHRASQIAESMTGARAVSVDSVERDQWVVTKSYARMAPFWRVRVDDGAGTDIYVMQKTGEIVQNTDRVERFWNWLGAVPHWIYFEFLRVHQELWVQVVMWTSGIGVGGSILGVWIGTLRVRLKRRYSNGSTSPYRGWMKWHHIFGLWGGIFVITWAFSGWWSMSPFGGFPGGDSAKVARLYSGQTNEPSRGTDVAELARNAPKAKEVRFTTINGSSTILSLDEDGSKRALDGTTAKPVQPSIDDITTNAQNAVRGGGLVASTVLTKYDLYWYSTGDARSDARPLPVLRLKFDDHYKTWLHIDPATGALLGVSDSGRRGSRWLFNALHSFDLPLLIKYRPVRDFLMILLSIVGLIVSISGIVVGLSYLRRQQKVSGLSGLNGVRGSRSGSRPDA